MKKRLRKKRHIGEFTDYGFEVTALIYKSIEDPEHNSLWNAFIDKIESLGLSAGGGMRLLTKRDGKPESFSFDFKMFVTSPIRNRKVTESDRTEIKNWLESNKKMDSIFVGDLEDAWN